MTPKEKASSLVMKALKYADLWDCYNDEPLQEENDIEIALMIAEEIITSYEFDRVIDPGNNNTMNRMNYWDEVKSALIQFKKDRKSETYD